MAARPVTASFDGERVLGSLFRDPEVRWGVVAETPATVAFRQVTRMRRLMVALPAACSRGSD